jgi:hypothetical protein
MHRVKQPAGERCLNRGHYGEVHVALLEAARQAGAAILDQMDLQRSGNTADTATGSLPAGSRSPGALPQPVEYLPRHL